MINFPCKCGNPFNLPEEMAGKMLQCPQCGLLVDVPTLSELANLREDGTFKLADHSISAEVHDQHAMAQVHIAFSRHTTDPLGREKDLRPDQEHFRAIGETFEEPASVKPKYDPATGELVRAHDLKENEVAPVIPIEVASPPTVMPVQSIGYATSAMRTAVTPAMILLELFQPANAAVLFFIFLLYLLAAKAAVGLAVGSEFAHFSLQILNIPGWLILAHYGCVIEETGPDSHDELPRPLRNLDLAQDIINPLVSVATAILISYAPAIIIGIPRIPLPDHARLCLVLLFELLGSFFLPAVLLTTVTGTTLLNLRPDRLMAVILRCGGDYILAVGVYMISVHATLFYILPGDPQWINPTLLAHLHSSLVAMPAMAVCVYLMHYLCWLLGVMYRTNHDKFPWILQRHISARHQTEMFLPPRRH